ncbi:LCP family protein [Streptomyces gobiensis]|uniref:LCP family protein n=1 Tax=Streptomyces gobiensis TaxID=2875706 RepID=UPI001E3FC00D|nr:LCP family protein [Streptomyces gobiensis]UGY91772.1 LCP family protein [Streptomyces gobiensis]
MPARDPSVAEVSVLPSSPPRSTRPRRPAVRRSPRWGLRISAFTAGAVLAVSGFGHAMVNGLDMSIKRVDPFRHLRDRPDTGKGLNFLVVGVDERGTIAAEEKHKYKLGGAPCNCTDTIMLVHLSEDRDRASVVSLPRDSYAEMPPHTYKPTGERHQAHQQKLNAAYAHGGPELTVRTVEKMTGVHIHHYLEVGFTSFMRTVDALGGVPVCTVKPLKDKYSGLDLPVGTSQLNGGEALQYVRARSVDGSADLGRMQRQQRFVASVIDKATSSGVLMNPAKFQEVTAAMLSAVRADRDFGSEEMLALGRAMHGFSPASAEFATVPVAKAKYQVPGLGETVKWDDKKAKRLFEALRQDQPLAPHKPTSSGEPEDPDDAKKAREAKKRAIPVEVAPGTIRVQVDNGTETAGLGHRADKELRATGFNTTGIPGNAERQDVKKTEIAYDPRWDRSARSLAVALPGAKLRKVSGQGPLMKVTLGDNFRRVAPVRAEPVLDAKALESGGFAAVTGDDVVCP